MSTANLGRVGFVNKGVWADGLHKVNDLVTFGTAKYACILQHTSILGDIIPTNTTYWEKWTDYGSHSVTNISNTVSSSADSQYVNYFSGTNTGVISVKITGLVTATSSTVDLGFMEVTITQDDRDNTSATNPPSYKFMLKGNMDAGVWYNTQAILLGTSATAPINVRFTRTASDAYIEIGETSSTWYYPTVEVAHVSSYILVGYAPIFLATIQDSLLGTTTDSIVLADYNLTISNINSATSKTTPNGTDKLAIWDSVSGLLRSLSISNLTTYFSTLFVPTSSPSFAGKITSSDTTVSVTSGTYSAAANIVTVVLNVASHTVAVGDIIRVAGITNVQASTGGSNVQFNGYIRVTAQTPTSVTYEIDTLIGTVGSTALTGAISFKHGGYYSDSMPKVKNGSIYYPVQPATAWVIFDGTTTPPTITGSFNISAVVRVSTGAYDIYFKDTMDNANYIAITDASQVEKFPVTYAVDKFTFNTRNSSSTLTNSVFASVVIFGGRN